MQVSKSFSQGCSFFDVVLNVYLTLNLLPKFIIDNNIVDLNVTTFAGQTFVFEDELIDDELQYNEILKNDYKFCTGTIPGTNNETRGNYLLIEPLEYFQRSDSEILATETHNLFLT